MRSETAYRHPITTLKKTIYATHGLWSQWTDAERLRSDALALVEPPHRVFNESSDQTILQHGWDSFHFL